MRELRNALLAAVALTVILGLAYPLSMTGVAQVVLPDKADGQATLVARDYSDDAGLFQSRPSVTEYAPDATFFNNQGPNQQALADQLSGYVEDYLERERPYTPDLEAGEIPPDAVTTSASRRSTPTSRSRTPRSRPTGSPRRAAWRSTGCSTSSTTPRAARCSGSRATGRSTSSSSTRRCDDVRPRRRRRGRSGKLDPRLMARNLGHVRGRGRRRADDRDLDRRVGRARLVRRHDRRLAVPDGAVRQLRRGAGRGRGKAHAASLRETAGRLARLRDGSTKTASQLRRGDVVVVEAGQVIPGDGEIVEGVASVDESAITGESAPVVREAGGDRSGVTGGTRVLSDRIVVRDHRRRRRSRSSTA